MVDNPLPFISWPVIAAMLIFISMIMIPFLVALKELFKPKDNEPLHIEMDHFKDPMYFGKAFKRMIREKVESAGNNQLPGKKSIKLSKEEQIDIILANRNEYNDRSCDHLLYVMGSLKTPDNAAFSKEIYSKGNIRIGRNNSLRAVHCEQDIHIGKQSMVSRWVCSEKNIMVQAGCELGRSIACEGRLQLAPGCRFTQAYGLPVIAADKNKNPYDLLNFNYPNRPPLKYNMEWSIVKKHVSINCAVVDKASEEAREEVLKEIADKFDVWDHHVVLPESSLINCNFAVTQPLEIKKNCTVNGCIKAYKDLHIGEYSVITGDVFVEGDVRIDRNCILLGSVFSQGRIYIGKGVRISRPDGYKSVIGKKRIELDRNVVIYGYLLTEGVGVTR